MGGRTKLPVILSIFKRRTISFCGIKFLSSNRGGGMNITSHSNTFTAIGVTTFKYRQRQSLVNYQIPLYTFMQKRIDMNN